MIKRFLAWLISIYINPTPVETKTPGVTMSEQLVDEQVVPPKVAPVAVQPAAEAKAGVADLDAALSFIESGIAQLGEAAKDELKELAKKYL